MQGKNNPTFGGKARGIPGIVLFLAAIILIITTYLFFFFRAFEMAKTRDRLMSAGSDAECYSQMKADYHDYVDELASLAGLYVSTSDATYLNQYFQKRGTERPVLSEEAREDLGESQVYLLSEAIAREDEMVAFHLTAMKLSAMSKGVDLSEYEAFSSVTISSEDSALTTEEKQSKAEKMLLGVESVTLRNKVIELITSALDDEITKANDKLDQNLKQMIERSHIQELSASLISFIALVLAVLIYFLFLRPLQVASKHVELGEKIGSQRGLRELRFFADQYDQMIEKKSMMEDVLRQSARMDALTGLPNRLAEKHYISSLRHSSVRLPVAILSLDVNNLKPTNDTHGHVAGDELLKSAAKCILACFGDETGHNCFRTGGDEFIAILTDVSESEVRKKIERFQMMQAEEKISVSVGYAYSEKGDPDDFEDLFLLADKQMYRNKAKTKAQMASGQLAMPSSDDDCGCGPVNPEQ